MYAHPSPLPPDPVGTGHGSPLPHRRVVITVGSPLPPDVDVVIARGPRERQTAASRDNRGGADSA